MSRVGDTAGSTIENALITRARTVAPTEGASYG
jgi:hypothetical protein